MWYRHVSHDFGRQNQQPQVSSRWGIYPLNMPDPTGSLLVTASYGHYGQRAARISPDSICRIRLPASVTAPFFFFFFFFFQRRHGSYCAKPTRIRSGWPGQDLAKRIWSRNKLVRRNHLARFLAGRHRPATSFRLSDSFPFFHRRPG